MQERNRYRVTGSIFLIALAVIVVPMIFDSDGAPATQVAPMPEVAPTVQELPDFADVVPVTDVVERVQALREEVDSEGFNRENATLFGDPVLKPVTPESTVWAVQVASFANLDNAKSFRQDLRSQGFEAFLSTVKESDRDQTILYRIAIGPLLSLDDAERMQQDIGTKLEIQPTLMEMTQ